MGSKGTQSGQNNVKEIGEKKLMRIAKEKVQLGHEGHRRDVNERKSSKKWVIVF